MVNPVPNLLTVRPGHPDFLDLPWNLPLLEWKGVCNRLEEVPRGLSRHSVVFINYAGVLYALKELSSEIAPREYQLLEKLEEARQPAVRPIGFSINETRLGKTSVLITRYLDHSIPFRSLFMQRGLDRYQPHLLDAIAGLLVQLHLAGIYWGDCSLSNTLFRRDDGALRAYLVDAETSEIYPDNLPPTLRHQDLEIMEENIGGELSDLAIDDPPIDNFPLEDTSAYIRLRYQRLWEEITREEIIFPGEHYRIQERIRALNELGFSVGNVALSRKESGDELHLRVEVTDRNYHRDLLLNLTGLEAEDWQARKIMNEIQEMKAMLSHENNRSTPLSVAAYHWLENRYRPALKNLQSLPLSDLSPPEIYCQLLEHKWYLSEKAHRDVGHQVAIDDFISRARLVNSHLVIDERD